ncbi:MAG: DUF4097 family beta strand repeat-containing protein [Opitutaceae bacterium]
MIIKLPVLLLASAFTLSAQTEERIDKRFPVSSNGQLVVDVGLGSIELTTHASNEVVVSAIRKITRRNKAEEEAFLSENPVTFSQEGNTIAIQSPRSRNNDRVSLWSLFRSGSSSRNEVKYTVTVPATFNARLKTSGGGIVVSDLGGELRANTSGGGLRFSRLRGPIDGHTSGGGIRVADCEGSIKIDTSGGGIEVTGGSGTLNGHSSGGSVTVKEFRGPARVETSGGGISIENVAGKVDGSTSGGSISARFSSPLSDEVKLSTSGGGVTVRVTDAAAFHLDASTSGGGVSSDLPVTVVGKISRGRLAGAVNGGGQLLILRSSGGSIRVKKI